jgi:alkylhydroperoxidase family enzyme
VTDAAGSGASSTDQATSEIAHLEDTQGGFDTHLKPFYETWLRTFIYEGRLDPQLRELAILRVLWRCGRRFEWGNHYRFARGAGVARETIASVKTADPTRDLDGPVAVVVRAADDVVDHGFVRAGTIDQVRELLDDASHVDEFLYLVAGYRMFASVSESRPEEPPGKWMLWPPDGVAPD